MTKTRSELQWELFPTDAMWMEKWMNTAWKHIQNTPSIQHLNSTIKNSVYTIQQNTGKMRAIPTQSLEKSAHQLAIESQFLLWWKKWTMKLLEVASLETSPLTSLCTIKLKEESMKHFSTFTVTIETPKITTYHHASNDESLVMKSTKILSIQKTDRYNKWPIFGGRGEYDTLRTITSFNYFRYFFNGSYGDTITRELFDLIRSALLRANENDV